MTLKPERIFVDPYCGGDDNYGIHFYNEKVYDFAATSDIKSYRFNFRLEAWDKEFIKVEPEELTKRTI